MADAAADSRLTIDAMMMKSSPSRAKLTRRSGRTRRFSRDTLELSGSRLAR